MRVVIITIMSLLSAGCTTYGQSAEVSRTSVTIPTFPGSDIVVSTRTGRLSSDGQCLLFKDDAGRVYLPVFRSGSSYDGRAVTLVSRESTRRVSLGTRLTLEGNVQQWADVPQTSSIRAFQSACRATPFLVSMIK